MRKIDAVIFDGDGTLFDTREYVFSAFEHVFKTHGLSVPSRSRIAKEIGKSLPECYRGLAVNANSDFLCETHHAYQLNNTQLINSYEGVTDVLKTLREHGMKIGLFTSRYRRTLDSVLKQLDMETEFDAVVVADDLKKHKPDPEGVYMTCEALGVSPQRAVVIGDAAHDIESGKKAGVLLTIGITHWFGTKESLANAGADHIVDRISDVIPLLTDKQSERVSHNILR